MRLALKKKKLEACLHLETVLNLFLSQHILALTHNIRIYFLQQFYSVAAETLIKFMCWPPFWPLFLSLTVCRKLF